MRHKNFQYLFCLQTYVENSVFLNIKSVDTDEREELQEHFDIEEKDDKMFY